MRRSPSALRIVVPAHDEAERIETTLRDYCQTFGDRATIVVVANGCNDDTASVVRRLQGAFGNLECMEIRANIGKGGAVRAGFSTAVEEFLAFVDADGSTSAAEFDRLFGMLRGSDVDALIGSRWLPGAELKLRQPPARRIASRAFNLAVRLTLGLHFSDTQCGAKLFRRSALQAIWSALEVADFAFDIEVLASLQRAGLRIREVPTVWSDRSEGSNVHLALTSWRMLRSLIRLRLRSSVLWRVPFVDYFGRAGAVPVKSGHKMLVLGVTLERAFADPVLNAFLSHLRDRGVELVDAVAECGGPAQSDAPSRLRFLTWYAFKSRRDYDALIEIRGPHAWWLPAFSAKTAFVVAIDGSAAASSAYGRWYKRCVHVTIDAQTAQSTADEMLAAALGRIPYAAVFVPGASGLEIYPRSTVPNANDRGRRAPERQGTPP